MKKLILIISLFSSSIFACEIQNKDLTIINSNENIKILCNTEYTSYFDIKNKIPLYVTEEIKKTDLTKKGNRTNDFREDLRLPLNQRSTLKDYYKSGYDRGHLSASANTSDPTTISESFLLTNMIPQNSELNRTLWSKLEKYARVKANLNKSVFVITGVTFNSCLPTEYINNGRVAIPDKVYKVILYGDTVDAYLVDNKKPLTNNLKSYKVSLSELNKSLCQVRIDKK